MKKVLLLLAFFLQGAALLAQISPRKRDSLVALLAKTSEPAAKIDMLQKLSLAVMGDSLPLSDQFGLQQIMIAEESRNPKLISLSYLNNSLRYLSISGTSQGLEKAHNFTKRGLAYAESIKDYNNTALFIIRMAAISRRQMNTGAALEYNNKAIGMLADITDDSVKVACYQSLGNTYNGRDEKLPALKSYLNALQIAEASKREDLISRCYSSLVDFYTGIRQYDLARDYAFRMLEISRHAKEKDAVISDYNTIAGIYLAEKQFDLAQKYYEKVTFLADSLNIDAWKFQSNINMMNFYFTSNQLAKGAAYFQTHPEIASYVQGVGMGHQIDLAKASIMTEMKKFDSAAYYFKKAEPNFEARATSGNRYSFYMSYASFFYQSGNRQKAADYLLKANALAESSRNLEMMQSAAKELDTVYAAMGNMAQSALYKSRYYQLKDSLLALGREKDLVNLQIEDERKRQERLVHEKAVALERKHNIQLMGLSIGIFTFLCLLLMLGRFRVSETLIKILSFIALIFLFEFVILIADQKIHAWTHGEPIKVILIKVVIAGILLPLHHVFEHKMIHYLTTRNKLKLDAGRFWNAFTVKKIKQDTPHT